MPKPPPIYQRAAEMRQAGMTRHEIAAEIGLTPMKVSKALHYARTRGLTVPNDFDLKPDTSENYLRHMRHKGALKGLGSIQGALRAVGRAEAEAILKHNQTGETFADTMLRLAIEAAKTPVKGHGQGPRRR